MVNVDIRYVGMKKLKEDVKKSQNNEIEVSTKKNGKLLKTYKIL